MKAKPFSGMDHRSIHLNVIDHHFQFFSACKLTYSPIGWYDWRMDKSNGRILTVMSFDWSFITKCPHSHWFGYEWSKQFIICLHAFKWIDVAKLLHSVFTFFFNFDSSNPSTIYQLFRQADISSYFHRFHMFKVKNDSFFCSHIQIASIQINK